MLHGMHDRSLVPLTRVAGGEGGGAGEVAGGALGLVVLVVAVGGPGAVRRDGVGVVARPGLMDGVAVRPGAARVVDGLLQRGLRRVLPAHAPFCRTIRQKDEQEKSPQTIVAVVHKGAEEKVRDEEGSRDAARVEERRRRSSVTSSASMACR